MKYDQKLSDMVTKRTVLEKSITDLVREFEVETGLTVTEIKVGRMSPQRVVRDTLTTAKVVVVL